MGKLGNPLTHPPDPELGSLPRGLRKSIRKRGRYTLCQKSPTWIFVYPRHGTCDIAIAMDGHTVINAPTVAEC
mgnify:CR=1 FL=1